MNFLKDNKAQLSIEGIMSGVIAVIVYLILVAYVFNPLFASFQTAAENQSGSFGAVFTTLMLILIDVIIPLLLFVTMFQLARPKVEVQQY